MKSKYQLSRRDFLHGSLLCFTGSSLMSGCKSLWRQNTVLEPIRPHGPASTYIPKIKVAFVRRREDYGMWWPGAVYEKSGREAQRKYTTQLIETAKELDVKLDLRPQPIYSIVEADAWLAKAGAEKADGLMLIMMDRQQHSWPTAYKAVETGIPTVIFSPLGTSFTTNTAPLAAKPGCVVYSAEQFDQALYGMKMLQAGAKIRHACCVVLKGDNRFDETMDGLGITLRHIPAKTYLDEYQSMPVTNQVLAMAEDYLRRARRCIGATRQDVINGVKAYFVARRILQREKADAITMDCLGTLADKQISLPCIAWSRMNDEGIPAACEADYGAVASHIIVQYLFGRPGFQQDPVADTAHNAIIGAHCSSPTRLNGFNQPPEPFDLTHHHGNRDAVPRTLWRKGQRITSIDAGDWKKQTKMLISVGTVMENVSVPPNGGCVVSVRVNFDGHQNVLNFPGFHQLFFYGDYKQHLKEFCRLFSLQWQVV